MPIIGEVWFSMGFLAGALSVAAVLGLLAWLDRNTTWFK